MKQDPDASQDAIDVDPQLIPELSRLEQKAQDEMKRRSTAKYYYEQYG